MRARLSFTVMLLLLTFLVYEKQRKHLQIMAARLSQGFAEIVLLVEDVYQAAQFYINVVGLVPEKQANEEWAWFWAGEPGITQRLALHRGPLLFEEHSPLPAGMRFGRVHFAFSVRRSELEAAAERVRSAGVTVYGPVRLEWMKAVSYYFYDPDGNLLEWWSADTGAETASA